MFQIQLTNEAFEGRNAVYLLGEDSSGPTTLVDTGVATGETETELRQRLAARDVALADVDRVLLTHWHHDHAGLAGAIQAASDATVFVHEADAPLVRGDEGALEALENRQRDRFAAWGMPRPKREELCSFLETHADLRGEPVDVTTVSDGDVLRAGDHDLEVVHVPGHAAGLVAYRMEREGRREAFVGDAVLPKYTPNVGGADVRVASPLASYLRSLQTLVDLDLDRAWPGHRGPIVAPSARARDIATHHARRTERVLSALEGGSPLSAWDVSAALFGDLHDIHVLHGPGEAAAHLDHLVEAGVVRSTPDGYVCRERVEPRSVLPGPVP
ncbi:MAG: MBL fold metallo-hydrolase [Halanaeroarchaeum sp.]